jgi:anti-sigma regulatory factor (Ser/Thr protein kinase)
MKEIALHILDIAENGVAAGAKAIEIAVEEDLENDRIRIVVHDNGKGMDEQMVKRVTDPFVTSRTTRVAGLGIPFLKAAAEECNGRLRIASTPGKGTRLEVEFQRSHIDRMPLGDLPGTLLALVVGFQEVDWSFRYRVDGRAFSFDTVPIKQELEDIPLTEPTVLGYIRKMLQDGIQSVQAD